MAKAKETLQAKAKKLDIAFEDATTVPQLEKLIADKEAENGVSGDGDDNKNKGKSFFYVVYVDAYRNDTTIVPRGIYKTKAKIERFEKMADKNVQSFEGKIPTPVLHKLADELKITVSDEDGEFRDSKEILEEMVQEL